MAKIPATEVSIAPPRLTHYRWVIGLLLLTLTMINYADRGVLGIVAPVLMKNLHLTTARFGIIASAFGWAYAPFMFIGGILNSYFKPKRLYIITVLLWSIFIGVVPLATGFVSLLFARLLFGASEGNIFPLGTRVFSVWFPKTERSRAAALMDAGIPLGTLVMTPIGIYLTTKYGWGSPFYLLLAVGVVWVLLLAMFLKNTPRESDFVGPRELEVIEQGNGVAQGTAEMEKSPTPWLRILSNPSLWATAIAFFCSAYVLYFSLNFLPTYYVKDLHMPFTSISAISTLPWVAATVAALLSGIISDYVLKKTHSMRLSRGGLACIYLCITGILLLMVRYTHSPGEIVLFITLASFFNFLANPIFFAVPADVTVKFAAQATGFSTAIASCAGIVAPLATGFLVQGLGSFTTAFLVVALVPIVGGIVSGVFMNPSKHQM